MWGGRGQSTAMTQLRSISVVQYVNTISETLRMLIGCNHSLSRLTIILISLGKSLLAASCCNSASSHLYLLIYASCTGESKYNTDYSEYENQEKGLVDFLFLFFGGKMIHEGEVCLRRGEEERCSCF